MVQIQNYTRRLTFLLLFFFACLVALGSKVFYLQIIKYDYYLEKALANQQGYTELEPRRGEIFVQDYHSGNSYRVATNTTLQTVFADPSFVTDATHIADKLYLLLFNEKDALRGDEDRLKELRKTLPADLTEEQLTELLKPKTVEELQAEFKSDLIAKLGQKIRQTVTLYQNPTDNIRQAVRSLNLTGIEIQDKAILVYPPKITDPDGYATKLAPIVEISYKRLKSIFEGKNRYVVLATKIEPAAADQIKQITEKEKELFKGIGFEDKSYRFYPEGDFASQVLGFMDYRGGQYGIEAFYNDLLKGKRGIFKTKLDGLGNQITVGDDTVIKPAIDGSDVYLTLDRSIQAEADKLIRESVIATQADSGQIIVMDPATGNILAMAGGPSFDPNEFWKAFDTEEVFIKPEEKENIVVQDVGGEDQTFLITDEDRNAKLLLLPVTSEEKGDVYYEKYVNNVGAAVYRNRCVSDIYEPGSNFKPLTMSAAIDSDSVTPLTKILDNGPIKVDEFTIDNALGKHYGEITMTQVLETSNNIGMAWVSKTIGRSLFYSYIKKYGFGKRTDIQLGDEQTGKIEVFTGWSDSELATHAFGQGISVTPVQMITAFSSLANDGVLMQPNIVKKIVAPDGLSDEIEPVIVRRAISKKSADTLTSMLVSVVEKGQAKGTKIRGYSIAGKTGTAQTYRYGRPLEGPGTTIASFLGYAPASNPKFVILVKLDRPRTSPWADATALPVFKKLTEYLLAYMGIPPDKY